MPLEITIYQLSLFVHVTAAIIGLGVTFAEAFTYPVAMRLDPRHLPYKHSLQLAINRFLVLPALGIILATGLYQADRAGFELSELWLGGTLAIVVVLALLLIAYIIPEDKRLKAMAEGDIAASGVGEVELSAEYLRRVRIEVAVGTFADLLVIVAVYLMVAKPVL